MFNRQCRVVSIVPGTLLLSTPSGFFPWLAKYSKAQATACSGVKFGGIVTPTGSGGICGKLVGGVVGSGGGAVGSGGGGGGGLTDFSCNTIDFNCKFSHKKYHQLSYLINWLCT